MEGNPDSIELSADDSNVEKLDKRNENGSKSTQDDSELDDLLDSALEDFDKPAAAPATDETTAELASQTQPSHIQSAEDLSDADGGDELSSQQEALFNELFSMAGAEEGQTSGGLEEMMKQLMAGQPGLMEQMETMTDNFDNMAPPDGSGAGIDETLQQTLNNLAQNVQGMQDTSGEPAADGDLLRMLSGMGLGDPGASGEGGGDMDFAPMMQNMMKGLMSKEVLYPSLKEISDKYPAWLDENKSKLEKKDFENYSKQFELMRTIVTEFDSEQSGDSDDVKKRRFDRILDVMQRMQEMGQPPKDLVGDMPAGFEMDANGLPKFPGNSDQCSVM